MIQEVERPAPGHQHPAVLAFLLMVPAVILLLRVPSLPTASWLTSHLSLATLPPSMQKHAEYVMFVPLSAVVVAFFRLTLGVPVLSLFRPMLTAIGFRTIGIPWGLTFLVLVLSAIVLVRPLFQGAHYYVRVPVLLSLTALFLLVPLMLDHTWHVEALRHFGYFPSISLALICERFNRIVDERGIRAALWPTLNMILSAIAIDLLARIPGALHLLLGYPEVLFLQGAAVLAIDRHLHFEWLAEWNPFEPARHAQAPQVPHLVSAPEPRRSLP